MAFASILRRSASSLAPLATRLVRGQRSYHAAVFTAINNSSFAARKPSFSPLVPNPRYYAKADDDAEEIEQIFYPFKFEKEPGIPSVRLTRTSEHDEDIEVEVHMPHLVTGKGEADNNVHDDGNKRANQSYIPLVVRVKSSFISTQEFSCRAYPNEIVIESFVVKGPDTSEVKETFMGPHTLNSRWSFYLEEFEIKPLKTNLWLEYMINKAQETG